MRNGPPGRLPGRTARPYHLSSAPEPETDLPRLAANLTMMFTELPFLDRFVAAARSGFRAVEFLAPYDFPASQVAAKAREAGVEVVLFNCPPGDWAAGERGLGALPGRVADCRAGIATAIEYAQALGCPRLHLMAGKPLPGTPHEDAFDAMVANVAHAADAAAPHGIAIMLEPINTRVDMPGYFYATCAEALAVADAAGRGNVMLQYDIYHMQIMEGDLARSIERHLPRIGHVQLADNPGRHEPGSGEINYDWLLRRLDAIGYTGWVGCEYAPAAGTVAGLGWAAPYL